LTSFDIELLLLENEGRHKFEANLILRHYWLFPFKTIF